MQDLLLIIAGLAAGGVLGGLLISIFRRPEAAIRLEARISGLENAIRQSESKSDNARNEQKIWLATRLQALEITQKRLDELTPKITDLQDILGNRQRRGAYGEYLLETQLADVMPKGSFTFQAKLSNGAVADCLIKMPSPIHHVVIDAKFPLEASRLLAAAGNDSDRKKAVARLSTDIGRHITKVAESYLIPGETADWALLYIPSEAVYADIYAAAPALLDTAYKKRIMLVSPATVVAVLAQLRIILRDHEIQNEVQKIRTVIVSAGQDAERLVTRVRRLEQHFNQVNKDVSDIVISGEKLAKQARQLEDSDAHDRLTDSGTGHDSGYITL